MSVEENPILRAGEHPAIDPAVRRRAMFFLGLAVGFAGFTMAMQMGLNANFLRNDIGLRPEQLGILEAFREGCGIVAFLVLALLAGLAEPLVGMAMLMLLGAGMTGYYFVPSLWWVVAASVVWSLGFHVWMPLPQSMTMAMAEPGRVGHRLGQMQAADQAGFGLGLVTALVVTWYFRVPMRPLYIAAGAAALIAAAFCLGIPRNIRTPGPRLVVHKRYALYYVLSFLEGWRKQIFSCFAGYMLVDQFKTPLEVLLLLFIAVKVIGYFASPPVGRLIDRVGERRVLMFYYACLTAFFVGYAFIPNVRVLYALFVIDNAFFVFGMALNTYAHRLAPRGELTPTLSMGVAVNHVAAVIMPIVGGIAWKLYGYQWPFLIGALAAAVSIAVAMRVPEREKRAA